MDKIASQQPALAEPPMATDPLADQMRIPVWLRYGAALLLTAIALVLTAIIRPAIGEFVFALCYVAVMISAWYGGLGPGLLATAVSILASDYFLVQPNFAFAIGADDLLRLAVEALVAVAISSLVAARRGTERALRLSNTALHARARDARADAARANGLYAIAADLSRALTVAEVADAIVRHTGDVMGAAGAIVAAVAPAGDELEILATRGYPEDVVEQYRRFALSAPLPLADTARAGQPVLIESRRAALERYPSLADTLDRIAMHAWANVPLRLPDRVAGAIEFSFAQPRGFDQADRTFLLTLAQQCAQALDRARLYEAEQLSREVAEQARERISFLAEASRLLAGSLDDTLTLQQVADLAVPRLADWCVIDMQADGGRIDMIAAKHVDPGKVAWAYELRQRYPVDPDAPVGAPKVIRTGEPELYSDISDSLLEAVARSPEELQILRAVGYRSLMIVPLRARGRVLGTIGFVIAETNRRYDTADLSFAQELADRAAVAIDHARLYQQARQAHVVAEQAADRMARLQRVTAGLSQAATPDHVADVIVQTGLDAVGADAGAIFALVDDGQMFEVLSFRGYRMDVSSQHIRQPANRPSPLLEALQSRRIVTVESAKDLVARWPALTESQRQSGDEATAAVPLLLDDQVLGVLYVAFRKQRAFTGDDRVFLLALAQQCAQALDRARLYEAERRARADVELARQRVALLADAGAAMASALDFETTLTELARMIVPKLADWCAVDMPDEGGSRGVLAITYGGEVAANRARDVERYRLDLDQLGDPVARVIRTGQPELVRELSSQDLAATPAGTRRHAALRQLRIRSYMCVPLIAHGRTLGALTFAYGRSQRRYDDDDLALAGELARRAALAIDNARLYQRAQAAQAAAERAAERTARLQSVTAALAAALTPQEVAEIVVEQSIAVLDAYAGAVTLLSERGNALEFVGVVGYPPELVESFRDLPLSQRTPLTDAVRTNALVLLETADERESRYPVLSPGQTGTATAALAAVPLNLGDRVIGALGLSFARARSFSAEDRVFMTTLARQCAQALDRARLYEAERRARAQAEAAVHLRDVFFSVAAHELKTPLTSLLGQAQLLQRRLQQQNGSDERYLRSAAVVASQAERLSKMVSALLDIARIEQGQLSIELAPLDLADLASQVVDEARPTLVRHTLVLDNGVGALPIDGDALRLEQVLQNLIGNAVKYSPNGGEVSVRLARDGTRALVQVSDQGIGIPETALPKLFGRFFRAENVEQHQISGMGIGLFVVREIVNLHGGNVAVSSQEGAGTTFTIELPLRSDNGAPPPSHGQQSAAGPATPDGRATADHRPPNDQRPKTNDQRRSTTADHRPPNDQRPKTNDQRRWTIDEGRWTNDQRPTTKDDGRWQAED